MKALWLLLSAGVLLQIKNLKRHSTRHVHVVGSLFKNKKAEKGVFAAFDSFWQRRRYHFLFFDMCIRSRRFWQSIPLDAWVWLISSYNEQWKRISPSVGWKRNFLWGEEAHTRQFFLLCMCFKKENFIGCVSIYPHFNLERLHSQMWFFFCGVVSLLDE